MNEDWTAVRERVGFIRERIASACDRVRRDPAGVTLVAVSKTFPAAAIDAAVAAGIEHIGENRVQELRDKLPELTTAPVKHLIGHLQSNKAKEAARIADVIQSIDSPELALRVGRYAVAEGKRIAIFVQVNVGEEPQKSGVTFPEAAQLCQTVVATDGLDFRGVMTIPPVAEPAATRAYFAALRKLGEEIAGTLNRTSIDLSMGMSDDFEIAIEEGATHIRVGRAIFGGRS